MEVNDLEKKGLKIINNENNILIILQHFNFSNINDLDEGLNKLKEEKKNKNKKVSIIVDINDLSKKIDYDQLGKIIHIIFVIKNEDYIFENISKDNNLNIIYKNSFLKTEENTLSKVESLIMNMLFISDEMNSIGPYLNSKFSSFQPKHLILKKMKINSKFQLTKFLQFIINSKCEELFLEDIFIELIIKKDQKDYAYNTLSQYFYYENGEIYIKNGEIFNTKIKNLKMIDCPLFAIKKDSFVNINKFKDISIDID